MQKNDKGLEKGLQKTRDNFFKKLSKSVIGKTKVSDDILDNLEDVLISSDIGVDTTLRIIDRLETRVKKDKYLSTNELNIILKEEIIKLLTTKGSSEKNETESSNNTKSPFIILIVGVNGVGKTTTIGKLANMYKNSGKTVLLGAADTFRAAAIEQLELWAKRVDVPLIKQKMETDPSSVAFDTLSKAKAQNTDVVIIDTAGRLHNKIGLMNELSKIKRVMQKVFPHAPNEVYLILDASTGQNAYEQAKQFTKATHVTGLVITKLDGTAKGGVVIGISDQFNTPVKYIGTGEKIDDLQVFDKVQFVESLFN